MRWWSLCIAVLLLAGCAGKDSGANKVRLGDGSAISLDLTEEQTPDEDDIRGALSGVVVNDAIYPVEGALVQVKGWNFSATTDDDGRFVFERMPPGLYVLEVSKEGHTQGLGTVNIKSGQVAKSVLQIPRLPFVAPYHRTIVIDEFDSQADRLLSGTRDHVVAIDGSLATLILEAKWDSVTSPLGDPLRYSMKPESRAQAADAGTGPNPLRVQFNADKFLPDEYAIRLVVRPNNYAVPPESSGRIFVTAFYIDPAPDGWSFVRGDT